VCKGRQERIPYARQPKPPLVILSPEEAAAFLEAVPSRRNRVALTTAYATGLRASEVVWLRIQDIDSSRMVIHVTNGKGGKRNVMLSPKLLGILRAYWDIERPRRPWLFPGRWGDKPLDPSTLNAACAAAVEATGISKHTTLQAYAMLSRRIWSSKVSISASCRPYLAIATYPRRSATSVSRPEP